MSAVEGTRWTTQTELFDGINSERLFGFDGLIADLVPDQAAFITFMSKLRRKAVDDPDHKYTEYRAAWLTRPSAWILSQTGTVTGVDLTADLSAAAAGTIFPNVNIVTAKDGSSASTVVVAGSVIQVVGQATSADVPTQTASFMVKAPSEAATGRYNLVLLTAAPGFNVITTSGATRSKLYVGGDFFGEGSDAGTATYENDLIRWASCEITKERFTISETLKRLVRAGKYDEAMLQYKYALARIKAKLERKLLYLSSRIGVTTTDPYSAPQTSPLLDANNKPIRTSISMLQAAKDAVNRGMLETRVFNFTSSSTYSAMLANLQAQFKYGSQTKWGFVGDGMLATIQALCAASTFMPQLRIMGSQMDEKFGLNVTKLMSPFGEINLVRDRTMTQDGFYTNSMFVVDPDNVEMLVYRDVQLYDLPSTMDIEDKEFRCELGLAVKLPESHGFWYVG